MANSRINLRKSDFQAIMKLASNHRWLVDKADELSELFSDDCKSDEQRELITKLFDRFNYFNREEWERYIYDLARKITEIPNLSPENTIISGMSQDSAPDSSQMVLQCLKVHLPKLGWGSVTLVNNMGNVYRKSKESNFKKNNIIVIDEFVGSGNTAVGKRNFLEKTFNDNEKEVNVFIRVVFCSTVGAGKLNDEKVNFDFLKKIKRAITDYETVADIPIKLNLMREIENGFSDNFGTHKMLECTLGYGKTESLFAIEGNFNIPNSVFPFLWWPYRKNGTERNALFVRYME